MPDNQTNGIYNNGACIKIVFNGTAIQVNKSQIKKVDIIRNDVVRLDIGEGALRNVYIKLADVIIPEGLNDATQLRDYIKELMIHDGFATEAKQDVEINELSQIKNLLADIRVIFQNGGGGLGTGGIKEPLREDESLPNIVYKGFAVPNANTYDAVWAIQKISRINNEIIYEWADGDENYDNVWDSRFELLYYPSGFINPKR
jgi:hypothetical protein